MIKFGGDIQTRKLQHNNITEELSVQEKQNPKLH